MASPSPISAEDAKASIEREGVYVLQDPLVGSRVGGFRNSGFPIKSPLGFEMLAQNSLYREVAHPLSLLPFGLLCLVPYRTYALSFAQFSLLLTGVLSKYTATNFLMTTLIAFITDPTRRCILFYSSYGPQRR